MFSFRRKKTGGQVGIGVRSDGIALASVVRSLGRTPELAACEFRPCTDASQRGNVLYQMVDARRLAGSATVFVLEPDRYHLILIEAPDVDPIELRQAVRWRIKDLIDFHIDDAVVDVFDVPRQRDRGRARLMYVVAARASAIRELVDLAEFSQLEIKAVDIADMALRNIAALTPADVSGTGFLTLEHDRGLINLTRQGELFLSRKLDFGFVRSEDHALHLDSLALELQRSFDYCESHFDLPPPGHLLVGPMEGDSTEVAAYLHDNLGLQVDPVDLAALLECREPIPVAARAQCLLSVGAALRHETIGA